MKKILKIFLEEEKALKSILNEKLLNLELIHNYHNLKGKKF